jgi:ATP-binding cassette, subfamily B, bacterial
MAMQMDQTNMKKEKPPKPRYSIWQSSAYMIELAWKRRRSVLWLCLTLAAVGALLSLTQLFITPTILGEIQAAVPAGRLIAVIALFAAALTLLNAASRYFDTTVPFARIELRIRIATLINEKYMLTSYTNAEDQDVRKKYDKAQMSTVSNDQATETIWITLTDLLKNLALFTVLLTLLGSLNLVLVLSVLATTAVSFFITNYLNGWGYRHRDEEAEYSRRMNYLSGKSQDYTLAKDVRIFGMRDWLEDMYASTMRLYQAFTTRGEKVYIWGDVADVILTFARNGVAYLFLIGMVLHGGMPAASFLLYFSTVGMFTAGMTGVLTGFSKLHKQSLDISAVREFLEYPEPFTFEGGLPLDPDPGKPYQIELRDMTFRYPGADSDTLAHIDLTIPAGEKLAVVGLNGAGKTTLVKLICGFLDPTKGEVLLNGIDIKRYNRRDYYRLFSAVFQDFSLLAATIAENIAQTAEGVDREAVRRCAEKAGLLARIDGLPDGFDTHVGKEVYEDGTELSGGETQRLMLARALYKGAPVLVLDEPTAALDPIAESDMYARYNELTGGRMAVYISHRLASTRFCDRIILIGDGGIAETGTHDELIAAGGRYAELFEIQSRYYREGGGDDGEGIF